MKDAFGEDLVVGTEVIYSTNNSYGTVYVVGTISAFHPGENAQMDRVSVHPVIASTGKSYDKDPIVYAGNTVRTFNMLLAAMGVARARKMKCSNVCPTCEETCEWDSVNKSTCCGARARDQ